MPIAPPPIPTPYQGLSFPKSPPAAPPGGAGPAVIVGGLAYLPKLAMPPKPTAEPEGDAGGEGGSGPSEIEALLARYAGPGQQIAAPSKRRTREEEAREAQRRRLEDGGEEPTDAPSAEAIERRGLMALFGRRSMALSPEHLERRGAFGDNSRANSGMAPAGSGSAQAAASLGLLHTTGGVQGRAGLGFAGRRGGSSSSPDASVRTGASGSGTPDPSSCLVPIDRRTGGIGARRRPDVRRRLASDSLLPEPPTAPPGSAEAEDRAPLALSDPGKGGRSFDSAIQAAVSGEIQAAASLQSSEAQPRAGGAGAGVGGDVTAAAASAAKAETGLELKDSRPQLTWRDALLMRFRRSGCNSFRAMEAFLQPPPPRANTPAPTGTHPRGNTGVESRDPSGRDEGVPAPSPAPSRRVAGGGATMQSLDRSAGGRRGGLAASPSSGETTSGASGSGSDCTTPSYFSSLPEARPRPIPGTTQPFAKPGLPTYSPPHRSALEAQNPLAARQPEGQTRHPEIELGRRLGPHLSDVEIGPPSGYDEKGKVQINKGKGAIGPRGIGGGENERALFAMGVALGELAHWTAQGKEIAREIRNALRVAEEANRAYKSSRKRVIVREQRLRELEAEATALRKAGKSDAGVQKKIGSAAASFDAELDAAGAHESTRLNATDRARQKAEALGIANRGAASAKDVVAKLSSHFRYSPETLQRLARQAVERANRDYFRQLRREASRQRRPGFIATQRANAKSERARADRALARAKSYFDQAQTVGLPKYSKDRALARANYFAGIAADAYSKSSRALGRLAENALNQPKFLSAFKARSQALDLKRKYAELTAKIGVTKAWKEAIDNGLNPDLEMSKAIGGVIEGLKSEQAGVQSNYQNLTGISLKDKDGTAPGTNPPAGGAAGPPATIGQATAVLRDQISTLEGEIQTAEDAAAKKKATNWAALKSLKYWQAAKSAALQMITNLAKQIASDAAMAAKTALQSAHQAYAELSDSTLSKEEKFAAIEKLEAAVEAAEAYAKSAREAADASGDDPQAEEDAQEAEATAEEAWTLLKAACNSIAGQCCDPPCVAPSYCSCKPKIEPETPDVKGGEGTSTAKHASGPPGLAAEQLPLQPPGAARGDAAAVPADAEANRTTEADKTAKAPEGSNETRRGRDRREEPPPTVDATSVEGPPKPPPKPPLGGSSSGTGPVDSRSALAPAFLTVNQYISTAALLDAVVAAPPPEAAAEEDAPAEAQEQPANPSDEEKRRRLERLFAELLERRTRAMSKLAWVAGMAATRRQAIEIAREAIEQIRKDLVKLEPIIRQLIGDLFGDRIRAERAERGIKIDIFGSEVRSRAPTLFDELLGDAAGADELHLLQGLGEFLRAPEFQRTRLPVEDDPLFRRLEMVLWEFGANIRDLEREIKQLSESTDFEAEDPRVAIGNRIRAEQQALQELDLDQIRRDIEERAPGWTSGGLDDTLRRLELRIEWADLVAEDGRLAMLAVLQEEADRNAKFGSARYALAKKGISPLWAAFPLVLAARLRFEGDDPSYRDWAEIGAGHVAGQGLLRPDFVNDSIGTIQNRIDNYRTGVEEFGESVRGMAKEIEKLGSRIQLAQRVLISSAIAAGAAGVAAAGFASVAGLAVKGFAGGTAIGAIRQGVILRQHGLSEFDWARTAGEVVYAGNVGAIALPAMSIPVLGRAAGVGLSAYGTYQGVQEIRERELVGVLDTALGMLGAAASVRLGTSGRSGVSSAVEGAEGTAIGGRRVTQFYDPARGSFGPGSPEALVARPQRGLAGLRDRLGEGPLLGPTGPRTWVSPRSASEQTWLSRVLTGRGQYRHYVEFTVGPGETVPVGGLKGTLGLGRYQHFVPAEVSLVGRSPSFGVLRPNPGQALVAPAGTVLTAAAIGYAVYRGLDDD